MLSKLETLPSGLDAVFMRQPDGVGASARLTFRAGALHETEEVAVGTAHYLEHVAILGGTKHFPSIKHLYAQADKRGLDFYGFTDWTSTTICVDGRRAKDVVPFCLELGLLPKLSGVGVEQERIAITEEARSYQFTDSAHEDDAYYQLFVGAHRSRTVTGKVDDIKNIGLGDVRSFYRNNWQQANARLTVCAQEPVSTQRKITTDFLSAVDEEERVAMSPQPLSLGLPWLEGHPHAESLRPHSDDKQALLVKIYNVDACDTFEEYVTRSAADDLLNEALLRHFRFRRPTTYGVYGTPTELDNIHHGTDESYGSYEITTEIVPSEVLSAADEIERALERICKEKQIAGMVLRRYTHWLKEKKYYRHYQLADEIHGSGQLYYRRRYDTADELRIVDSLSTKDVISVAQSLTADPRKTFIAGPQLLAGMKPSSRKHTRKPYQ